MKMYIILLQMSTVLSTTEHNHDADLFRTETQKVRHELIRRSNIETTRLGNARF